MGFFDNMKQIMEIKQRMDEVKKRLDTIEVISENEFVKVTVTGNRKIKDVEIKRLDDRIDLEAKIKAAVNEAMEKAENVLQSEMMGATKGMMPDNLPGM